EARAIGGESQRRWCHTQGLPRRHRDIDALYKVELLAGRDPHGKHVVGTSRGHEDPRHVGRRLAFGGFGRAVAPHHIAWMRADTYRTERAAGRRIVVAHPAIGPVGHEEGFAIGMEENAIGAATGLVLSD